MNISNSKYRIRRIEATDNPTVRDIILSVMADYGCIGEGYSSSDPEVQSMYEAYTHEQSAFFVIENLEGEVLGCGGIGPLAGAHTECCELKKMYFLNALRGQGLGQLMIDTCLDAARQYGYTQCYLETLEAMEAANHLYNKNGFAKLNQPYGATGHSGCDAYYIKAL